jgi:hypothetical protein
VLQIVIYPSLRAAINDINSIDPSLRIHVAENFANINMDEVFTNYSCLKGDPNYILIKAL